MSTGPSNPSTSSPAPNTPHRPDKPSRLNAMVRYLFLPHAKPGEIVIISHSNLFYWWPVWLTGFIMAILTGIEGHRMALVPKGTVIDDEKQLVRVGEDGKSKKAERYIAIMPEKAEPVKRKNADGNLVTMQPEVTMAASKNYGILYVVILLLVVFITNVPLRGLWSLFTIIFIILLSVIFAQAGLWDRIFNQTKLLAIHINVGGYLFISVALFIIWLINFFFFDRQFYMIFTPGQVRMHLEIGAGEIVYDTSGMVFQKQRSDMFRHWILGFGSGDLIVRPSGSNQHIDLPNVLHVGRKVSLIEKKLKEKEVVSA